MANDRRPWLFDGIGRDRFVVEAVGGHHNNRLDILKQIRQLPRVMPTKRIAVQINLFVFGSPLDKVVVTVLISNRGSLTNLSVNARIVEVSNRIELDTDRPIICPSSVNICTASNELPPSVKKIVVNRDRRSIEQLFPDWCQLRSKIGRGRLDIGAGIGSCRSESLAQTPPQYLSCRSLWQYIHNDDPSRHLKRRHFFAQIGPKLMWVGRRPRSHNNCRGDILAKTRMRDAECRSVGDGRMSHKGFFDLNG